MQSHLVHFIPMPASPIRAITLDLDDTLWPIGPTIHRAEQTTHQWLADRVPAFAVDWPSERLRELRMSIYRSRADLHHDILQIRRLALQQAFDQSGHASDQTEETIEGALAVFMEGRNQVEPYPEVVECLQRLARHYPIASLTNGNADLAKIGLDHLFHSMISAHAHGTSKPDPALFHLACRALACEPHEVVHVGDDAALDVRAARAAGLQAVWINRDGRLWSGDDSPVVARDLLEFERWLADR